MSEPSHLLRQALETCRRTARSYADDSAWRHHSPDRYAQRLEEAATALIALIEYDQEVKRLAEERQQLADRGGIYARRYHEDPLYAKGVPDDRSADDWKLHNAQSRIYLHVLGDRQIVSEAVIDGHLTHEQVRQFILTGHLVTTPSAA